MTRISLEDAQARLPKLIAKLRLGEEVQLIQGDRPVARLVGESARPRRPRQPVSAIGRLVIVSDDDEHLKDFEGYMPGR